MNNSLLSVSASPSTSNNGSTAFPTTEATGEQFEEPYSVKIIGIVLCSLSIAASILGNIVVCKAACKLPFTRKPFSYYLVTNMAVAEIVQSFCLPFILVYLNTNEWHFGEFACSTIIPLQILSTFVVTNTLAAIAFYRFFYIVFMPSRDLFSRCKMKLLLCLLWGVALAVVFPLFMFYKQYTGDSGKELCNDDFPNKNKYEIVRFTFNFATPILIMVLSYGVVAWKLKKRIKAKPEEMFDLGGQITAVEETMPKDTPQFRDTEAVELPERRGKESKSTDLETDLLKMIYAVIIVFIVCYLPFQVHFLFIHLGGYDRYPQARKYQIIIVRYLYFLASLSSALHPLCYGTMSKFYARAFSKLVLCKCTK